MTNVLLVVRPFGPHAVGDLIAAPRDMREVLAGAHVQDVIKVAVPMAAKDKQEEA